MTNLPALRCSKKCNFFRICHAPCSTCGVWLGHASVLAHTPAYSLSFPVKFSPPSFFFWPQINGLTELTHLLSYEFGDQLRLSSVLRIQHFYGTVVCDDKGIKRKQPYQGNLCYLCQQKAATDLSSPARVCLTREDMSTDTALLAFGFLSATRHRNNCQNAKRKFAHGS